MDTNQRLIALNNLKEFLEEFISVKKSGAENPDFNKLNDKIKEALIYNGWFTEENVLKALNGIVKLLNGESLKIASDKINNSESKKTIALIMAGNIPCVGFHDLLCVLLSGNIALIKLSSDDNILIPVLIQKLIQIEPEFEKQIKFAENRLQNFDAVIATGSNNSSEYFNYYFSKYPHIIRKNRKSIAIITGNETDEELTLLGNDIFDFFGLGCRNVSKVFVPENYVFDRLFECLFSYSYAVDNKKYGNNYEYNRAIYLMTQEKFLDNNFLIIKEDKKSYHSPVGVLIYESYNSIEQLEQKLINDKENIQCIISQEKLPNINTFYFGQSQSPSFFDYADEVDTLAFLSTLN